MHNRFTIQAFASTLNDGLSFGLSMGGDTGPDVTPDPVNWLDIYTQQSTAYGYNQQRLTGISEAITLSVATTAGGLQRKVSSEPFILDPNSGWTATANGATFSVLPNYYVGFRVVATKLGQATTTISNASDGNAVLDSFVSTVGTELEPPQYQGEFAAYGTGWRWMITANASNQTYSLSYALSQLMSSLAITDSNGDAGSPTYILGNQFYQNYYPTSTPVLTFRPSSTYGSTNQRAQNFINAFPNGYIKVYVGTPATNGNQVRTLATKAVFPENAAYVRFSGGSYFADQLWPTDAPVRIEFYTS